MSSIQTLSSELTPLPDCSLNETTQQSSEDNTQEDTCVIQRSDLLVNLRQVEDVPVTIHGGGVGSEDVPVTIHGGGVGNEIHGSGVCSEIQSSRSTSCQSQLSNKSYSNHSNRQDYSNHSNRQDYSNHSNRQDYSNHPNRQDYPTSTSKSDNEPAIFSLTRSATWKPSFQSVERLRAAKSLAENALKNQKIFTIQGPYAPLREALRDRGWVELFYKPPDKPSGASQPQTKPAASGTKRKKSVNVADEHYMADDVDYNSDSDNDYDGDGNKIDLNDFGGKVPPWEEENGYYAMTSRLVRQATPTLFWGVRPDVFNIDTLKNNQIINHFRRSIFTSKVGLCTVLRELPWFEPSSQDVFFPRCYLLSHAEEKQTFIDDFFLTACISLLKNLMMNDPANVGSADDQRRRSSSIQTSSRHSSIVSPVPVTAIITALEQCKRYLKSLQHDDIDCNMAGLTETEFDSMISWYYKVVHDNFPVSCSVELQQEIEVTLANIKLVCPQYELDGIQNVWIVKPGAQSRGRGIQCYNRLEDMLKLVDVQVVQKESKYVVQKYIERPLLIYKTKFDIRQWFLVTDWNPFTMWFYKRCYLRFCSQEFTLDDLNEAVHLSNNSIQKNYKNGERAVELPEENMWTSEEFKHYLCKQGHSEAWESVIYPGMKHAVTCALLCSQATVEQRKNAFALYGADFMLTEDLRPWLIEINSSPCMAASTEITAHMCNQVLEDTVKVVIDRKTDRNADTGQFELVHRMPQIAVPPYIGMNLQVEGQSIKKPVGCLDPDTVDTKTNYPTNSLNKISDNIIDLSCAKLKSEKVPSHSNLRTNPHKISDRKTIRQKKTMFTASSKDVLNFSIDIPAKKLGNKKQSNNSHSKVIFLKGSGELQKSDIYFPMLDRKSDPKARVAACKSDPKGLNMLDNKSEEISQTIGRKSDPISPTVRNKPEQDSPLKWVMSDTSIESVNIETCRGPESSVSDDVLTDKRTTSVQDHSDSVETVIGNNAADEDKSENSEAHSVEENITNQATLDKRTKVISVNDSKYTTFQNNYDETSQNNNNLALADDRKSLVNDTKCEPNMFNSSNNTQKLASINQLTFDNSNSMNSPSPNRKLNESHSEAVDHKTEGSDGMKLAGFQSSHIGVDHYMTSSLKIKDHQLGRRALTYYPTVQAVDFLSPTVHSLRQSDKFPCRRTVLTNVSTESAWTAEKSQTAVFPRSFRLKSKSYHYQQQQNQQLLLEPVPPLSGINKFNISSTKESHSTSLSENPLLHSSPAARKVHAVRTGFTYQSVEQNITSPIIRKKGERSGEELPTLMTRFLDANYRCGKLKTTHNFDLLLTRNLTVGSQSFNHAF